MTTHKNNIDDNLTVDKKRSYGSPSIINVGSVETVTQGYGSPVGDPPHNGTTGYYNANPFGINTEVDLDILEGIS